MSLLLYRSLPTALSFPFLVGMMVIGRPLPTFKRLEPPTEAGKLNSQYVCNLGTHGKLRRTGVGQRSTVGSESKIGKVEARRSARKGRVCDQQMKPALPRSRLLPCGVLQRMAAEH